MRRVGGLTRWMVSFDVHSIGHSRILKIRLSIVRVLALIEGGDPS